MDTISSGRGQLEQRLAGKYDDARHERWKAAQAKEAGYWARNDVMPSQMDRVRSRYGPVLVEVSQRLRPDSRILDVGSGPTCAAQFLEVGAKTYLDPLMDRYLDQYFTSLPAGEKVRGMAESIPAPSQTFDVVVSVNALDHMCAPEAVLEEIHRVLLDDGLFVLGIFLHSPPIAVARRVIERCLPFAREDAHPYSMTRASVRSLLQSQFVIDREVSVFRENTAGVHLLHREDRLFLCSRRVQ